MRLINTLLTICLSSTLLAQQNTIALTVNGNSGADQTMISFNGSSTSFHEEGVDMEKVFPSNINNPTIYTIDTDSVFYSINTMPVSSLQDTIIPIYVQNTIAENYQIQIVDIMPLASDIYSFVTIPSTGDTLEYEGQLILNLNLNSTSIENNVPTILFHFGTDHDLNQITLQKTDATCHGYNDGQLEIDSPFDNLEVIIYDEYAVQVKQIIVGIGLSSIDSIAPGNYSVVLQKGFNVLEEVIQIGINNNDVFEIAILSQDASSLNLELEVSNTNYTNVTWDMGDNTYAYSQSISHTFQQQGFYDVVMTIETLECLYNDTLTIDFTDHASIDELEQGMGVQFHYSKRNGIKAFKNDGQFDEYMIYSFDGRLIEYGDRDFDNLPYLGSQVIIKYKMQSSSNWNAEKLIAVE